MIIQLEISSQAFKYDFTQIDCFDLTIGNMLSFTIPNFLISIVHIVVFIVIIQKLKITIELFLLTLDIIWI